MAVYSIRTVVESESLARIHTRATFEGTVDGSFFLI